MTLTVWVLVIWTTMSSPSASPFAVMSSTAETCATTLANVLKLAEVLGASCVQATIPVKAMKLTQSPTESELR